MWSMSLSSSLCLSPSSSSISPSSSSSSSPPFLPHWLSWSSRPGSRSQQKSHRLIDLFLHCWRKPFKSLLSSHLISSYQLCNIILFQENVKLDLSRLQGVCLAIHLFNINYDSHRFLPFTWIYFFLSTIEWGVSGQRAVLLLLHRRPSRGRGKSISSEQPYWVSTNIVLNSIVIMALWSQVNTVHVAYYYDDDDVDDVVDVDDEILRWRLSTLPTTSSARTHQHITATATARISPRWPVLYQYSNWRTTWRIFLHLTTDGHLSRSATTSQNSRRPHQASPWTPRLDRTIFRYCLKHALYIYHFTIMYDDHIHLCKYLLPLKKDSILVSQVPEKKCENRPVTLPRVKCEEVVVSRLHCWYS